MSGNFLTALDYNSADGDLVGWTDEKGTYYKGVILGRAQVIKVQCENGDLHVIRLHEGGIEMLFSEEAEIREVRDPEGTVRKIRTGWYTQSAKRRYGHHS